MQKKKSLRVYFEEQDPLFQIVSDPNDAEVIIHENGSISLPNKKQIQIKSTSIEAQVSDALIRMGIPANIKGYRFIRQAVILLVENPEFINRALKTLYPSVAENFGTTSGRVQRGIRHAIEVAWKRGNSKYIVFFFQLQEKGIGKKFSNTEFLERMAETFRA